MIFHINQSNSFSSFYNAFVALPFITLNTLVMSYLCIAAGALKGREAANAVAVLWARICCSLIPVKVRIHGTENYNTSHKYVVVSNHQSMLDIPVIHGFLGLNIKWVMKKELEKIPVFGTACRNLGCIFINRKNTSAAINSLAMSKNSLNSSESVFFFPEGTRAPKNQVLPFKKGAFFFAGQSNLPILPVTIINTADILPRNSLRLKPCKTVDIIIHPAVMIHNYEKKDIENVMKNVRDTIIASLKKAN